MTILTVVLSVNEWCSRCGDCPCTPVFSVGGEASSAVVDGGRDGDCH